MSGDVTLGGASTDTVSIVGTVESLIVSVVLYSVSTDTVTGFSHGDWGLDCKFNARRQCSCHFSRLCDESADAITVNGDMTATANVAIAGSFSLSGDVTLGSVGTDTITINCAISAASTLTVSGVTTLNGATSMTGTVGLGNEATDIVTISGSATDATAIAGRHDLHRWRRDLLWRGHSG